jgi:hypothetical protein
MCNSNYPDARSHSDFDASGTYWFQNYFGQWYYRVFSGHPVVGSLQTITLPQTVYIPDVCVFYENTTGSPKTGNIAEVYSSGPAPLIEVLRYQPENIIQGTDLPDLDGHQDGVITWGSNPSGVTIATGSFQPTNPTQYGSTPGSSAYAPSSPGTIDLGNPIAPPQLYTELDTSKIPGAAAIDDILNAGQVPRALWWFPFIFLGIDIIGLLVYDSTQRTGGQGSLLAMCVTILILLIICGVIGDVGVSGMIPLWTAILFIIPAAALILSRRHVGWG